MNYLMMQNESDSPGIVDDYLVSLGQDDAELPLEDALFVERLKFFYEQGLTEIRAFAQREGRPYDQIRTQISELHCKGLFGATDNLNPKEATIETILKSISRQLESLQTICGLQSFYLAVNPTDPSDEGFLGGTVLGREFWRGHRGCGAPGAKAFELYCQKALQSQSAPQAASSSSRAVQGASAVAHIATPNVQPAGNTSVKKSHASTIKAEVYLAVRNAVRAASGQRQAEMKWTNHSKLSTYGVELVGWPENVPKRNPSALSAAQNQAILDALQLGKMWFRSIHPQPSQTNDEEHVQRSEVDDDDIFEDTIDFTGILTEMAEGKERIAGGPSRSDTIYDCFPQPPGLAKEPDKDSWHEQEHIFSSEDFTVTQEPKASGSGLKRRRDESEDGLSQDSSNGER